MSMSWTNLDSFKVLALVIEVDEHYSFLILMHNPWSTPKCGLVRLWVLHFWNFLRLKLKKV
jgi:hypothetical protein